VGYIINLTNAITQSVHALPAGAEFFSSPPRPDLLWGLPSPLSNGYRGSSSGTKRPECGADHLPPSTTEVNNAWSYIYTHPYVFKACWL